MPRKQVSSSSSNGGGRKVPPRKRCGQCEPCLQQDCGNCYACRGKKKFGGDGSSHHACVERLCVVVHGPDAVTKARAKSEAILMAKMATSNPACSRRETTAPASQNNRNHGVKSRRRRKRERPKSTDLIHLKRQVATNTNKRTQRQRELYFVTVPDPPKKGICAACQQKDAKDGDTSKKEEELEQNTSKETNAGTLTESNNSSNDKETSNEASSIASRDTAGENRALEGTRDFSNSGSDIQNSHNYQNHGDNGNDSLKSSGQSVDDDDDDDDDSEVILLCDGAGCGREFHMSCCVPALSKVPDGAWYCQDCSMTGSTAALQQYFEEADQAKVEFLLQRQGSNINGDTANDVPSPPSSLLCGFSPSYVKALCKRDAKLAFGTTKNITSLRVPVSELVRAKGIHETIVPAEPPSRTRGGGQLRQKFGDNGCPPKPEPNFFLGKPIRLYVATEHRYHTGRIVDYRVSTTQACFSDSRATEPEYLVRFPAGKDDRKTPYQHWIFLEEHSLACGSSMIWGEIQKRGRWQPAMIWLRNSRELIPVQHELRPAEGEILYLDNEDLEDNYNNNINGSYNSVYTSSPEKTRNRLYQKYAQKSAAERMLASKKSKVWAVARPFGVNEYRLLYIKDEAVDLFSESALRKYYSMSTPTITGNNNDEMSEMQLFYALAVAEHNEQMRVRKWHNLKQANPFAPRALSGRDEYALEPLLPSLVDEQQQQQQRLPNQQLVTSYDSIDLYSRRYTKHKQQRPALCPLIPRGLDRFRVIELLDSRGIEVTKDEASSIACKILPIEIADQKTRAKVRHEGRASFVKKNEQLQQSPTVSSVAIGTTSRSRPERAAPFEAASNENVGEQVPTAQEIDLMPQKRLREVCKDAGISQHANYICELRTRLKIHHGLLLENGAPELASFVDAPSS